MLTLAFCLNDPEHFYRGKMMGERKLERSIPYNLEAAANKAAREDDEFVIEAFQERKKTLRLKRVRYLVKGAKSFSFDTTSGEMALPLFLESEDEMNQYELVLIKHLGAKTHDHRSRYIFRSLGQAPFRLNGTLTYEAFVERGDTIDIGYNRLHFPRPKTQLRVASAEENLLSPEMIGSLLNVMIEGETGTGKTTLARNIHEESKRHGPFVHLNLSSFSPGLIESELFGHVRGAFTGAMTEKKGAILEAGKGTLFLDEIDSLTPELQTKLLLFLDNHEVRAVGGGHSVKANVRLIFASGTPLRQLIGQDKMRRDFYYRLTSGIVLSLESLRQNPEKIKEHCLQFERDHYSILSDDLISFYQQCPWPGNLRQLYAHLHKKKILSGGKKLIVDQSDYALKDEGCPSASFYPEEWKTLEQVKLEYCMSIFNKVDKNISRASKLLEISPNTLKAFLNKSRDHEIV